MMVNIRTRVAPMNLALFSSRSAALIERKMFQITTLSIKLHHCTLSGIKTQVISLSDVLPDLSIHCADQRQHSIPDFSTKAIDNTQQTCVGEANDVENHLFCSLDQCK